MLSPADLKDVLTEIAEWTLDQRRAYLANIATAFGVEAERQIKDALLAHWKERKNVKEIA